MFDAQHNLTPVTKAERLAAFRCLRRKSIWIPPLVVLLLDVVWAAVLVPSLFTVTDRGNMRGVGMVLLVMAMLFWAFWYRRTYAQERARAEQESAGVICPDCGYDLRGANHDVCPECGKATT